MNKHIKSLIFSHLIVVSTCFGQSENVDTLLADANSNNYEKGILKDGYKEGIWEYYDKPGELSLKVNYDNGELLFLISDTSDFSIKIKDDWIYSKLDMQPRYIGSMVEFYKIISTNTRYPLLARKNSTVGLFYVTFEIDTSGHIANFNVINDIGDGCSEEIIRVIKLIPDLWLAAIKNENKYASRFILPINFSITLDGKAVKEKKDRVDKKEELPIAKTLEKIEIKALGVTRH